MIEFFIILGVIGIIIMFIYNKSRINIPKSVLNLRKNYIERRKESTTIYVTKDQKNFLIDYILPKNFNVSIEKNGIYYFKNAIIVLNTPINFDSQLNEFISSVIIISSNQRLIQSIKRKLMDDLNDWEIENLDIF